MFGGCCLVNVQVNATVSGGASFKMVRFNVASPLWAISHFRRNTRLTFVCVNEDRVM
jgi:hypothetical protein